MLHIVVRHPSMCSIFYNKVMTNSHYYYYLYSINCKNDGFYIYYYITYQYKNQYTNYTKLPQHII